MAKVIVLVRRRVGMSVDDFWNHWRTVHGPMAASLRGLVDYRQNLITDDEESDWDGVGELTFETTEAMVEGLANDELKADLPNFISVSRRMVVHEHVLRSS